MNEFLKLNWRIKDASELEPQYCFLKDDVVSNSLVYKYIQDKALFHKEKNCKELTNIFDSQPYIPGGTIYQETKIKSGLTKSQHCHCIKALRLMHSGKDVLSFTEAEKYSIQIYNKLKANIAQENSKYEQYALSLWDRDRLRLQKLRGQTYLNGKQMWEKKLMKVYEYPKLYKELMTFNMSYNENEDGDVIDYKCVQNVLEVGTLARFSRPSLKSKCILKVTLLPKDQKLHDLSFKRPVSQDKNIDRILVENHVDIALSLSTIKCLTDNSDPRAKWTVPVIVKEVMVPVEGENKTKRKVVLLDKPFPQRIKTNINFIEYSLKQLIKTHFCQYEAFRYPGDDIPADPRIQLGGETKPDGKDIPFVKRHEHHGQMHHNATYRIWKINKSNVQNNLMKNRGKSTEINVLVRSKLDACETTDEGTLQPVILKLKLERQPHLGANIATKSELAREWAALFFTPFSNLYRIRLSSKNEVICTEKCNIQKVITEAQTHHEYKPHLGLGILQKVFAELIKLEPGNYLLHHLPKHEAFVSLLKECTETAGNSYNLHEECTGTIVENLSQHWIPIDINFVLPSFEAHNRMPGMFTAPNKIFSGKKGKGKTKKKKNKKPNNL